MLMSRGTDGFRTPNSSSWMKQPLERSTWDSRFGCSWEDSCVSERFRMAVAERSRREHLLRTERIERVAFLKLAIRALHLGKTDRFAHSTVPVVQASLEGTSSAPANYDHVFDEEEVARHSIHSEEFEEWFHLYDEVAPRLQRAVLLFTESRIQLSQQEQQGRFDIWQEEESVQSELVFRRSTLRHTETVVTQLIREGRRVEAISQKMEQLGSLSIANKIERQRLHGELDRRQWEHRNRGDNGSNGSSASSYEASRALEEVRSSLHALPRTDDSDSFVGYQVPALPPFPHSEEDLHSLRGHVEALKLHLQSLRLSCHSEQTKLAETQHQLRETESLLHHRQQDLTHLSGQQLFLTQ
ncbi:hypothetical protein DIPPA_50934 [Diplonema papillatum]|nr:hypothetical protein DIPPA_50934 [Diplonema papillatum]